MNGDNPKPVIFLAFANDRDNKAKDLRNLPEEARRLRTTLDQAKQDGLCNYVMLQNSTVTEIFDVFQSIEYRDKIAIFHFGGHANGYQLLFETSEGAPAAVDAGGFAKFLAQQAGLQFVFLNGCSTEQQVQGLLDAGISAVIATSHAIEDKVAMDFADRFYRGLAGGASIYSAYMDAEGAVRTIRGSDTQALYRDVERKETHVGEHWPWILYPQNGTEKAASWNLPEAVNDPLFGIPPRPTLDLPNEPYRYLANFQREHTNIFFGRSRKIRELYDNIVAPDGDPILLLYGQSGVGKTSFLAAGLLPHLERDFEVVYRRRIEHKSLLGLLATAINAEPEPDKLLVAWQNCETKAKKPYIVVLDQIEEWRTHPTKDPDADMHEFMEGVHRIFANRECRPRGKLILSFRKEWFAEIEEQVHKEYDLPFTPYRLERLKRKEVIEAITGPERVARLKRKYQLEIEPPLPEVIVDDLLTDPDSPVATVLQILLSRLWQATPLRKKYFDVSLYQTIRRNGIALSDFLNQQIKEIYSWRSEFVDSGLIFDILAFYTTPLGTSLERSMKELKDTYQQPHLDAIILKLKELYLLSDTGKEDDNEKANRLAHDTLAPLVRARFDASNAPGQRARRILESRQLRSNSNVPENTDEKHTPLSDADLDMVVGGHAGMRLWTKQEEELVKVSYEDRERRRKRGELIRNILIILVLLIAVAGGIAFWQWGVASEQTVLAELEANNARIAEATAVAEAIRADQEAENARDAERSTLIDQSQLLASQSQQQYQVDPIASAYLAFHALPNSENERPYVAEAEFALAQSTRGIQETRYLTLAEPPFGPSQFAMSDDALAIDGENLYLVEPAEQMVIRAIISTSVDSPVTKRGVDWGPNGLLLHFDSKQGIRLFDTTQCNPNCVELPKPQTLPIESPIGCAEWSPTDERMAICTDLLQILSTDGTTQEVDSLFTADVEWSPMGDQLAAWGNDWDEKYAPFKKLLVWNSDNTITTTLDVTDSIYADLLWLDNEHLLTIHEKEIEPGIYQKGIFIRSIRHWNNPTYIDTTALQGMARVQNVTLSPDGRLLLTFLDNGVGQFWQIETDSHAETPLRYVGDLPGHTKSILSAEWYDNYLATTSMDGTIHIWQIHTEEVFEVVPISTLHGYPGTTFDDRADIFGAKWLDNQENPADRSLKLLTYGEDGSLRIWNIVDSQGSPICTGVDSDGIPQCIDENSKYETADTKSFQSKITYIRVLGDGTFVTASSNGTAGLGPSPEEKELTILPPPMVMQTQVISTFQEYGVAWDEQGKRVLVYLVHDESVANMVEEPFVDGIVRGVTPDGSIAFSTTIPGPITNTIWVGDQILVNGEPDVVRLVNVNSGAVNSNPGFDNPVVAAKRSSARIATLEDNGQIKVWNKDFSEVLFMTTTQAVEGNVSPTCNLLEWSDDGTKLLTGGGAVVVWDVPVAGSVAITPQSNSPPGLQGQRLDETIELEDQMNCVWLGPNNVDVAFANHDRFFVVNSESGDLLWENADHDEQINGMEWTTGTVWPYQQIWPLSLLPENDQDYRNLLLTWSVDGTARLWDVAQQTEIMRMGYQESKRPSDTPNQITAAAVSQDGVHILTATSAFLPEGETGIIREWQSWYKHPECLLQTAKKRITRSLTNIQLEQFGLPADANQLPEIKADCP